MTTSRVVRLIREAVLDASALLLPVECVGCGAPDRGLCAHCRLLLTPHPAVRGIDGMPVWAGLTYDGIPRRVILELKESARTDVARYLAPALLAAVDRATPGTTLCLVPSSPAARRARGYEPVRLIAGRAGVPVRRLLRSHSTGPQKALDAAERARHAAGTMRAARDLRGSRIVLVDDVVTTGATLLEARRALVEAGAEVVGAAVVASTPRRQRPRLDPGQHARNTRRRPTGTAPRKPGDTGAGRD